MTWQLMWRNVRGAALNAMLQLLVIYRLPTQRGYYVHNFGCNLIERIKFYFFLKNCQPKGDKSLKAFIPINWITVECYLIAFCNLYPMGSL